MIAFKPPLNASDDTWHEYADDCCLYFNSKLSHFLIEGFGYKPRWVNQRLGVGLTSTIKAYTMKYDLYLRMFPRPEAGWPRETLVIARIGFKDERKGHGRRLLTLMTELAPELGYKHIAIECANENSSAFGRRFGLQPMDERGSNWIGTVDDVQRALEQSL
ncbi:hypothetical protein [Pseudomonas sp. C2B4]|uniref:hypothetical protein n=1 Tax=Pseudomonas sp. C2B4 TaxID=2735270 RepID=UPI001586529A|nr:hypothetical protein [Pseudomonas sp. C2B4]NUU34752.1 hypothetical protein [Pseudomonas sp. C2B4]